MPETVGEPRWTNRIESDGIRSWETVFHKAILNLPEEGEDFWVPSWEQCIAFWPYLPDQLHRLEDCLRSLPAKDPVFKYLKNHTHDAETDYFEPSTLILRGQKYPRSVLAFCARYLTTYRQHLNLPAPPHPLTRGVEDLPRIELNELWCEQKELNEHAD
ncbi:hypothetical protein RvY_06030-2 [Ramazzottius varieornatus]|uniref:Uncharacterized protein n=1 Tax=Ramazzottius varieornatus TaxID=947166 RepID=A0A1D1UXL8_RAMVA|nr:hypothetical protein RvY_06030-2 [Ramazzottius varieornatus]